MKYSQNENEIIAKGCYSICNEAGFLPRFVWYVKRVMLVRQGFLNYTS